MWLIQKDVTFLVSGRKFEVPKGYWFDGASVPRFLWSIASPTGKAFEAACLHDWLYDTRGSHYKLTRKQVDIIFLQHMEKDRVSCLQRYMYYLGVRIFGGYYWQKDTYQKFNT